MNKTLVAALVATLMAEAVTYHAIPQYHVEEAPAPPTEKSRVNQYAQVSTSPLPVSLADLPRGPFKS